MLSLSIYLISMRFHETSEQIIRKWKTYSNKASPARLTGLGSQLNPYCAFCNIIIYLSKHFVFSYLKGCWPSWKVAIYSSMFVLCHTGPLPDIVSVKTKHFFFECGYSLLFTTIFTHVYIFHAWPKSKHQYLLMIRFRNLICLILDLLAHLDVWSEKDICQCRG